MKLLKLKSLLKSEGDRIQIKIVGKKDPVQKTFNGITKILTPLDVLINGESYLWEVSEEQKQKIKEAGCGATFWITAYKAKSGYIGFNYVPNGDVALNFGEQKTVNPSLVVDETQERIIRGMCWNAAVAIVSERNDIKTVDILTLAKDLHKIGAEWLRTGKDFANSTPETSYQTHETASSEELPLSNTKTLKSGDDDYPDFLND